VTDNRIKTANKEIDEQSVLILYHN